MAWEQAKEKGEKVFSAESYVIPIEKAGIFKSQTKTMVFCLHQDIVPMFEIPEKTAEWLSAADVAMQTRRSRTMIKDLYLPLQAAWEQAKAIGEKTFSTNGYIIPVEKAGIFRATKTRVFCLYRDNLCLFEMPEKTADWLGINEMAKQTCISTNKIASLYKAFQEAWQQAEEKTFTVAGYTIPVDKAKIVKSGPVRVFCLHRDLTSLFVATPPKTAEWLYSPTFTKRHDRQYCYYISRSFAQNRDHPDGVMARLPAHEIEAVVEKAVRDQIKNLCAGAEERTFKYILEHHDNIPTYDLVRTCVGKITVRPDLLTIHIKPEGFRKLADKHLKVDMPGIRDALEIAVPFKVGKAKRGAIVIQPENTKDIFDLPPAELKKLVQGIAWRDEHFAGKTLTEIAHRENCSDAHVGKCIMHSFGFLRAA